MNRDSPNFLDHLIKIKFIRIFLICSLNKAICAHFLFFLGL